MGSGAAEAAESLVRPESVPGSFSANVAFTSEYYFRGISQTDDAPALQGGIDYELPLGDMATYLGAWASNVDFNEAAGVDGATIEIDWFGGLRGSIGETGITWDVGMIYFTYPGADDSLNYDFVEAQGSLGYDFGIVALTASINATSDNYADSGDAFYPKLAAEIPVGQYLTLGAYVARYNVENNTAFAQPDYTEWNVSGSVGLAGFDVAVTFSDTSIDGDRDGIGPAVLFSVSRSF